MSSPLVGYDFTISAEKFPDLQLLQKTLSEWFKKYVFQKEEGKGGYIHWQGRGSLIKAKRRGELISQAKESFPGVNWSITSKDVHTGQNFNYVLKAESRIDGPWTDKDYEEPPVLTRQLKGFMERGIEYEWHKQALEWCDELEDRSIKVILDMEGNSCKSLFAEYLEYQGKAWEVPPFRLMEDISQCIMAIKAKKCYLVDMPRGMKKDKLGEFYSGLECLKNGICWDKRYSFKKRRMDRPQVIVFTNTMPILELLSADRWEIYEMQSDKSLTLHDST